ncbi:phage portal protein [Qipengyuania sp. 6B39]|uniref:phage portal protein n=1 Tax=Qipengyuania proteolytica TaxID=2867239 RepID=UPI001C89C3A6|nr:phage portal protein [Qipengyuania proteolytica]MBX7496771.1 phage portal protein [Qipengyuania proteolytica]
MKWWKGALGLERDGASLEGKSIVVTGLPSRHDGTNFRTNMVTLAQFEDAGGSNRSNPIGLTATWACVNLIAGTIASLPLMVYRTVNGVREVARGHPLYYVLHESPNFDQTAMDFWEYIAAGIELRGDGFAEIDRRSDGSVLSLIPIRPDLVKAKRRAGDGQIEYEWTEGNRRIVRGAKDVLHIRGPMGNALGGASTLSLCGSAFSGALAAEQAARSTFSNGLRPSGTMSTDTALTKEQRAEVEALLQEKYAGSINAGRPMLLDNGLKWEAINITPEDAQMLESRKFSGEEICRIFGVPPAMVGYGDKASNWGTGKEVDVLGFQKFTLRRRLKRIEQALMKQLLTARDRSEGITIEFNLEGLLRGDSAGRASFYKEMTQMGAMTINEVRALENMAPVPGGDVPRIQMQNAPIGETGQEG